MLRTINRWPCLFISVGLRITLAVQWPHPGFRSRSFQGTCQRHQMAIGNTFYQQNQYGGRKLWSCNIAAYSSSRYRKCHLTLVKNHCYECRRDHMFSCTAIPNEHQPTPSNTYQFQHTYKSIMAPVNPEEVVNRPQVNVLEKFLNCYALSCMNIPIDMSATAATPPEMLGGLAL